MERIGYGLKGVSTGSQALVFFVQFGANLLSRFGIFSVSIGSIIAAWMVSTLMVAGIIYLIGSMIVNAFKRSELEKWLLHSTWGTKSADWDSLDELARLEQIIHKPQIHLTQVPLRKPAQWMDPGTRQWQLTLTLPTFTKGKLIGLQVTRTAAENSFRYGDGNAEGSPTKQINEQNGTWSIDDKGNPVYRLNLGGTTQDTITVLVTMPFNWQASENEQLGYVASGRREGELFASFSSQEFASRIIKVGGEE
jgi:hypothetical protein